METMQDYTCYCTEEQTRRAYELGAPIESKTKAGYYCNKEYPIQLNVFQYGKVPTTQQMIGWLREEKHLTIVIDQRTENNVPSYRFLLRFPTEEEKDFISDEYYGTWNNMELAAIDAALDYLEKGKSNE